MSQSKGKRKLPSISILQIVPLREHRAQQQSQRPAKPQPAATQSQKIALQKSVSNHTSPARELGAKPTAPLRTNKDFEEILREVEDQNDNYTQKLLLLSSEMTTIHAQNQHPQTLLQEFNRFSGFLSKQQLDQLARLEHDGCLGAKEEAFLDVRVNGSLVILKNNEENVAKFSKQLEQKKQQLEKVRQKIEQGLVIQKQLDDNQKREEYENNLATLSMQQLQKDIDLQEIQHTEYMQKVEEHRQFINHVQQKQDQCLQYLANLEQQFNELTQRKSGDEKAAAESMEKAAEELQQIKLKIQEAQINKHKQEEILVEFQRRDVAVAQAAAQCSSLLPFMQDFDVLVQYFVKNEPENMDIENVLQNQKSIENSGDILKTLTLFNFHANAFLETYNVRLDSLIDTLCKNYLQMNHEQKLLTIQEQSLLKRREIIDQEGSQIDKQHKEIREELLAEERENIQIEQTQREAMAQREQLVLQLRLKDHVIKHCFLRLNEILMRFVRVIALTRHIYSRNTRLLYDLTSYRSLFDNDAFKNLRPLRDLARGNFKLLPQEERLFAARKQEQLAIIRGVLQIGMMNSGNQLNEQVLTSVVASSIMMLFFTPSESYERCCALAAAQISSENAGASKELPRLENITPILEDKLKIALQDGMNAYLLQCKKVIGFAKGVIMTFNDLLARRNRQVKTSVAITERPSSSVRLQTMIEEFKKQRSLERMRYAAMHDEVAVTEGDSAYKSEGFVLNNSQDSIKKTETESLLRNQNKNGTLKTLPNTIEENRVQQQRRKASTDRRQSDSYDIQNLVQREASGSSKKTQDKHISAQSILQKGVDINSGGNKSSSSRFPSLASKATVFEIYKHYSQDNLIKGKNGKNLPQRQQNFLLPAIQGDRKLRPYSKSQFQEPVVSAVPESDCVVELNDFAKQWIPVHLNEKLMFKLFKKQIEEQASGVVARAARVRASENYQFVVQDEGSEAEGDENHKIETKALKTVA